ncbi:MULTISPECIES: class I SAM-dependent DNA methyltransferase [Methylobacterium]|uniref:class I SAM-dependent DNA methyltransferase n=1 Tax=Methylobacterium TaxID=407 RepID=UPI0013EDAEBF|nr:SAM-dependent methyltransferase [Methylobacterium sp. DB0501]NGM36655.1 methyltransferase domain-containing protein [Methylobacterium sp. DB0501]
MTRHTTSLPPDYFDARYAADPDPWNFAASPYERDKYAATLETLPRPHYAAALEIGCSIGVLTAALGARCDALLAIDVAEAALTQARTRCRDLPGVRLMRAQVPGEWPEGRFDLILLSEVVYYLDAGDVAGLAARIRACLLPGGDVVLVHWTGETHYPLTGDEAADLFIRETSGHLAVDRQVRTGEYRLDVLRGREAEAVEAIGPRRGSPGSSP